MIILALALGAASAPAAQEPYVARRDQERARPARVDKGNKQPRKFREVLQPIQYDGDYSPAAGRLPEPAPSPTTPVRYIAPWERDIPVIAPPKPRYVDEATIRNEQVGKAIADNLNRDTSMAVVAGAAVGADLERQRNNAETIQTTSDPTAAYSAVPGPLPSPGSVTGSTATANYGSLPSASPIGGQANVCRDAQGRFRNC